MAALPTNNRFGMEGIYEDAEALEKAESEQGNSAA